METEHRFIRTVLKYCAYGVIGGLVAFPVIYIVAFVIGLALQFA